jgi:uncharacterized surface protein with fasciclin (FAS1) repeats
MLIETPLTEKEIKMKTVSKVALVAGVCVGMLALVGCGNGSASTCPMKQQPSMAQHMDIVDTAVAAGSFKTLVTAVKEAGLVETLKSPGPFTVFAPTDEAFAKLPHGTLDGLLKDKEQLKAVLLYHVVPGKVMAADVVKLHSAKTAGGATVPVKVEHGKVFVGPAQVVKTDIAATNGVIHVIDTVLIPPAK